MRFATSPSAFHALSTSRGYPTGERFLLDGEHARSAGEDARIRVSNVISELKRWKTRPRPWSRWNDAKTLVVNEKECPTRVRVFCIRPSGRRAFRRQDEGIHHRNCRAPCGLWVKAACEAKRTRPGSFGPS